MNIPENKQNSNDELHSDCHDLLKLAINGVRRAAIKLDGIINQNEPIPLSLVAVEIRLSLELFDIFERRCTDVN